MSHSILANLPIGVFDSGIGGITVLKALATHFPHENFLFLGDTARLPYGSKSPETIRRYVLQNIEFLKTSGVKAIVVACNSASSVLRHDDQFGVPVFGVIEPGARAALAVTAPSEVIGVLGTRATISGKAYDNLIHGLRREQKVIGVECPLLVPLVEEGWEEDVITEAVVRKYVSGLQATTVILGCTHYPVLKELIQKVMGSGVRLIDSAEAVALQLDGAMKSQKILAGTTKDRKITLCVTDNAPHFQQVAARLLQPLKADSLQHI